MGRYPYGYKLTENNALMLYILLNSACALDEVRPQLDGEIETGNVYHSHDVTKTEIG